MSQEHVGVRQLRQQASALVERVATGVTIQITNRGRPVAQLVPIGDQRTTRTDLIASGELQPGRGDVLGVQPIQPPAGSAGTEQLLDEQRADR